MSKKTCPIEIIKYVEEKVNSNGGRPHFLNILKKKRRDPLQEFLNILEMSWIKGRSNQSISNYYKRKGFPIDRSRIFRMIKPVLPHQSAVVEFLKKSTSRLEFYNKKTNTSDFETVQMYIDRARRFALKRYKGNITTAKRCWIALGKTNPANWTADQVLDFFATLPKVMKSNMLDAVRQIAPQIADKNSHDYIATGRFREMIGIRKKPLFAIEIKILRTCLENAGLHYELVIFDLHITGGFREGSTDTESGITGLSWGRFHKNFSFVDDYECKTRQGVFWRDCPIDLFFKDLPRRLRRIYNERGKPKPTDKIIPDGYKGLLKIYKTIKETLTAKLEGKVDPDVYQEFITLRPHDADKIHCNLLWEAGVPLEVVAGQYQGRGEGVGLVGRGWQDVKVIKKHYLSLTQRSPKFKEMRAKIDTYAGQF